MSTKYLALLIGALSAAACSSTPPPVVAAAPASDSLQVQAGARARADSSARADAARAAAERLAAQHRADSIADAQRRSDEARATLSAMVHFDFDRADVTTDGAAILDKKIAVLRATPAARILVSGNCDERGSDEYNLALGNRRAVAVRQYLIDHGVDPARIETTSYGEERPVDSGHTEAAWAMNRNDQFSLVNATVVF